MRELKKVSNKRNHGRLNLRPTQPPPKKKDTKKPTPQKKTKKKKKNTKNKTQQKKTPTKKKKKKKKKPQKYRRLHTGVFFSTGKGGKKGRRESSRACYLRASRRCRSTSQTRLSAKFVSSTCLQKGGAEPEQGISRTNAQAQRSMPLTKNT